MPYAAHATQGTQLKVSISSVFTNVPGVEDIDGPGGEKQEIDVTAISDTATQTVGGIRDYGEMTFNLFYDPADTTHQYLHTSFASSSNAIEAWKVVLPDAGAAELAFSGWIKTFKHQNSRNSGGMVQVAVRLTGAVTITP